MNTFISPEKLGAVRICKTTGHELVSKFGTPSGEGRDGDFGTLSWNAAAMVSDSEQVAMSTQSVHAWIDSDGLVAGFVVNPTALPGKPMPCREQERPDPGERPDPEPLPAEPKPATAGLTGAAIAGRPKE